ncbi:MAG: inositol monophosphatase family protein [Casimicrobiaceae bacterium]
MSGHVDLQDLSDCAVELAAWAVTTIRESRPQPTHARTKADAGDWVTPFDEAVERTVRERLMARFPDHVISGEEFGRDDDAPDDRAPVRWHLDPIDGTMNFVHGIPWVAFSLAAADAEGVAVGVVADVYRNEIFRAIRGGGAWLGGQRLHCGAYERIAGGVFLTEWSGQQAWPHMDRYLARVSSQAAATRIMGSCALALTMVGAGRASGAVIPGKYNSWDVYAGALIAREAGAVIYDRHGMSAGVPLDGILAAPAAIADKLWGMWMAPDPG